MKDAALQIEGALLAAGSAGQLGGPGGVLDLNVDQPGFSTNWREGFLQLTWPALPNHKNPALSITFTLYDSADYGSSFQPIVPQLQFSIAGAANGVAAGFENCPVPPGLRGPLAVFVSVPPGVGDCTAAIVDLNWMNE
jgi:hypothetical protein